VTFHDAACHALALLYHGVFVTADERYVRRTANAGNLALLRHWKA